MKGKAPDWLSGPSVGIVDSLIASGMVSNKTKIVAPTDPYEAYTIPMKKRSKEDITSDYSFLSQANAIKHAKTTLPSPKGSQQRPKTTIMNTRSTTTTPVSPKGYKKSNRSYFEHKVKKRKIYEDFTPQNILKPNVPHDNFHDKNAFDAENFTTLKRRTITSKDGKDLLSKFTQQIESFDFDEISDPNEAFDRINEGTNVAFIFWNKAIADLRGFSEEYALLLNEIKQFFRDKIKVLPTVKEGFENIINSKDLEIQDLNSKNDDKQQLINDYEKETELLRNDIDKLKETIDELHIKEANLNDDISNIEYEKEQLFVEVQQHKLKTKKDSKMIAQLTQDISKLNATLKEYSNQIQEQEATIFKYNEEGASFRPMYLNATNELRKLKEVLQEKDKEIEKLSYKAPTSEIEINTEETWIAKLKESASKHKKKRNKKKLDLLPTNETSPTFVNAQSDVLTKQITASKLTKSDRRFPRSNSRASAIPPTLIDDSGRERSLSLSIDKRIVKSLSRESLQKEDVKVEKLSESEQKKEEVNKEETEIFVAKETKVEEIKEKEETKQKVPEKEIVQNRRKELKPTVTINGSIPDDYNITNNVMEVSETIINSIFRLLPLPLTNLLNALPGKSFNAFKRKFETNNNEVSTYSSCIRTIVEFIMSFNKISMQDIFSCDMEQLLKNYFLNKCRVPSLLIPMYRDFISSLQFYTNSQTAAVFLQFVFQEFTTIDFIFLSILFNFSYNYIYPKMETLLIDPDLTPVDNQFLIHTDICENINMLLFPHTGHSFDVNELRNKAEKTPNKDLVSFWDFAIMEMTIFRKTHQQFNKQVKSILRISGYSQNQLTYSIIRDFMLIINPSISDVNIKKLWDRYSLGQNMKENKKLNAGSFISFCADFPELSNQILSLPFSESYEKTFSDMSNHLQSLVLFIRKRYCSYIRDIFNKLPNDIRHKVELVRSRIRNGIVKSDASTLVTCYRHFLQLIDLSLTEKAPYISFDLDVSKEEIDELLEMIKIREQLISIYIRTDEIEK